MSQLLRIARQLHAAANEWGHIENEFGAHQLSAPVPIGTLSDPEAPYAVAFRLELVDPRVGGREFTITISETVKRR